MPDRCEKEQTGAKNSNLWTTMPSSTRLTRSQFQAHDAIWNRQGSSGHTTRRTPASPPAGRHGTGPGHLFTLSAPAAAVGPCATSMPIRSPNIRRGVWLYYGSSFTWTWPIFLGLLVRIVRCSALLCSAPRTTKVTARRGAGRGFQPPMISIVCLL
jgi:hypothetical protein